MTTDETRALSRKAAEAMDTDEAWLPAEKCPQGHANDGHSVRELCAECWFYGARKLWQRDHGDRLPAIISGDEFAPYDRRAREDAHPEWIIARGEPKPYAEDAGLLIGAIESFAENHSPTCADWSLVSLPCGGYQARFPAGKYDADAPIYDRDAEALARAFVGAVERWAR